jgi:hypothetical protein
VVVDANRRRRRRREAEPLMSLQVFVESPLYTTQGDIEPSMLVARK